MTSRADGESEAEEESASGRGAESGADAEADATTEATPGSDADAAADAVQNPSPEGGPGTSGVSPRVGAGLLDEQMGPSSAMAHLYRGEIHRMKLWRERLDRTTNWAVIVIAALLTWAFSSPDNPHYIVLIGVATLTVFLVIEARRYRGYDIWRTRVRILQQNVWAYGLDPEGGLVDEGWRSKLGDDYRTPTIKITSEEAIAHRLRRVYLPLFLVLLGAWLVRITAFSPDPWVETAAVGMIPGEAVLGLVGVFYAGALVVALRPRTWHAKGELRSEDLRKRRE